MQIQVHDFAGHPFQAELSRHLAARGHSVQHLYSTQYASNHGSLERAAEDPSALAFFGVTAGRDADKYHPVRRLRFEAAYADAWIAHLTRNPVDVVMCANVPLIVLSRFAKWARAHGQAWVLWHQDVVSAAMAGELERRLPAVAARAGARQFAAMERRAASGAKRIVAIGDAFRPVYERWGIDPGRIEVVPNWAPLSEIVPKSRNNAWALAQGLRADLPRIVYSGTLGRKHRPELLIELSRRMRAAGTPVSVVVVSEGEAAEQLQRTADAEQLQLTVLPFQPMSQLSDVLSSADCLVALLEPGASRYSVPSKVLSYFAAGRPVLGFMPTDNPAARDIVDAGGAVCAPATDGVAASAVWLSEIFRGSRTANALGRRARAFAEQRFDIERITDRFETVLTEAAGRPVPARGLPRRDAILTT